MCDKLNKMRGKVPDLNKKSQSAKTEMAIICIIARQIQPPSKVLAHRTERHERGI